MEIPINFSGSTHGSLADEELLEFRLAIGIERNLVRNNVLMIKVTKSFFGDGTTECGIET